MRFFNNNNNNKTLIQRIKFWDPYYYCYNNNIYT